MPKKRPRQPDPNRGRSSEAETVSLSAPQDTTSGTIDEENFKSEVLKELNDMATLGDCLRFVRKTTSRLPRNLRAHFYDTALRSKYARVRRFAAEALGQLGPIAQVSSGGLIEALLADSSPNVRCAAAEALTQIPHYPEVRSALERASQTDKEARVRSHAKRSLDALAAATESGIVPQMEDQSAQHVGTTRREALTSEEARALLSMRRKQLDLDSVYARIEDHRRAIRALLPTVFQDLPNRAFSTLAERQAVAEKVRDLLHFARLRIECPKCGRACVPIARLSGTGRDGVFQFSHSGSPATHGGTKRFPAALRLIDQPADGRKSRKVQDAPQ